MLDMFSLETLILVGNSVVNNHPALVKIEGNQTQIKKALEGYFGVSSSLSLGFGGIGSHPIMSGNSAGVSTGSSGGLISNQATYGGSLSQSMKNQSSFGSNNSGGGFSSSSGPAFL
jgi:hypothetical protein